MDPIALSIFDLFKIGPGPSSSHTMAPMLAGLDFLELARSLPLQAKAQARGVTVQLFGSLGAAAEGHGTVRAVLAGLMGQDPGHCPPDLLDRLGIDPDQAQAVDLHGAVIEVRGRDIRPDRLVHDFPFQNTLVFTLNGPNTSDEPLLTRQYFSVGGGFLQWPGQKPPRRGQPVHPYDSMRSLKARMEEFGLSLHRLVLENEMAVSGLDEAGVQAGLDHILAVMDQAVQRGLAAEGVLPGPLGLMRKARKIHERAMGKRRPVDQFLAFMAACAFAVAEENAAGHVIVTAPTCGSSGVIPAVAQVMRELLGVSEQSLREGLLAAAAVGFLAKHNATIAGAEGGCQAEIGVASAMAAALLAQATGYGVQVTENAAEIALEHHLGLTCDPVRGYVQIPCIERNAMGAAKAYTAYLIASDVVPAMHKVGLDEVMAAMRDTGRDMCTKYKETSLGGLATCMVTC